MSSDSQRITRLIEYERMRSLYVYIRGKRKTHDLEKETDYLSTYFDYIKSDYP